MKILLFDYINNLNTKKELWLMIEDKKLVLENFFKLTFYMNLTAIIFGLMRLFFGLLFHSRFGF